MENSEGTKSSLKRTSRLRGSKSTISIRSRYAERKCAILSYQVATLENNNLPPVMVWQNTEGNGKQMMQQRNSKRSIFWHVKSKSRVVEKARHMFRGNKKLKSPEYSTEMNDDVFLDWVDESVLPILPNHSVLVLVCATNYMQLMEATRPENASMKWKESTECLVINGVVGDNGTTSENYVTLKHL